MPPLPMAKVLSLRQSIMVHAAAEKIFDYASDVNNDRKWRLEVERMELKGKGELG